MTTDELRALRALCDAATQGPWRDDIGQGSTSITAACGTFIADRLLTDDAAFIARSRTVVPSLLDEVERLRRDRDSYANSNFEGQLSEARAEVERLKEKVATWEAIAERDHGAPIETVERMSQRIAELEASLQGCGAGMMALEHVLGPTPNGIVAAVSELRAEVERLNKERDALVQPWADDVRLSARLTQQHNAAMEVLRGLLREAHRELSTIEAITVSPSDTDGLIDLVRRIEEALK